VKTIELYYDVVCPYAYLGSTQIDAVAARARAKVEYKPILLGGLLQALWPEGAPFTNPNKARLGLLDLDRWARAWGVPLRFPEGHPRRTVDAMRLCVAAGEERARLTHALYRAYWAEGRDVGDPAVLREIAGEGLAARCQDPAVKAELRARTEEAASRGVFGVPTFIVDGQLFWGQDRLGFVEEALGLPPPAPPAAAPGSGRTLEFWYDFSSPFSYLASTQVEAIAERAGARLEWKPMLLGGLFKIIGTPDVPLLAMPESKRRHSMEDMCRWASHWGVPFTFPTKFPMTTVTALRMALCAGDRIGAFSRAVYRAYWAEARDISDPAVLREIAGAAGLEGEALLRRTQEPSVKEELRARTDEAARRGICGAPSFFVEDELFWGQDRLHFVEAALRAG
jgi:2-hydroxychromene-2-carboxylate isomerase